MQLLQPIRRWLWRVKLGLCLAEMRDVHEEMSEALEQNNFGVYRALADFHTELACEAVALRAKLGIL